MPSPDQFTVAVRFSPLLYKLRDSKTTPVIPLPYRMIFAVATKCSVYLYDTQQKLPFGLISNIHYTRLTDLAWSNDGNTLLVSSTDGYCSIVQFADGELGEIYEEQTIKDILAAKTAKEEPKKKKKVKKIKKDEEKEKSPMSKGKENADDKMDVDPPEVKISITNFESLKEIIPVDKIIKSNDIFSPEKQVGSPATPIAVRKYPRNFEDVNMSPLKNDGLKPVDVTTPKGAKLMSSKTPTRIEVRREKRVSYTQPVAAPADNFPAATGSPMNRKIPANDDKVTPKAPRRVELRTLSTPKAKKKL